MTSLRSPFPVSDYLQPTEYIDKEHPLIQNFLKNCNFSNQSDADITKHLFLFVRDEIAHSYDIQGDRVTGKASEVLQYKESICYGKSHLLAAFLRGCGIPSGICYQKLTLLDTPESGYCIHALNTVFLQSINRWIRLDARGNKPGVNAEFSIDKESLAFHVRAESGERDYLVNHKEAHPLIRSTLTLHKDGNCMEMYLHHLPANLD